MFRSNADQRCGAIFAAPYKVAAIMADLVPVGGVTSEKTEGASELHVAVSESVIDPASPCDMACQCLRGPSVLFLLHISQRAMTL